ncbi:solute carrier family 2, facilitated glucose transporter member 8-like isoform X2 [Neocloeon triangulifer]|nr:solute carrier family 2, facilitated glucose transporter member 8-like isoform X2 [Neocloeon triangulifer]
MKKNEEAASSLRVTAVQILVTLGASLSMLSPGMALGFSAVALPQLTVEGIPNKIDPFNENIASWFASISNIATPVGCLLSAWTLERVGRKFTLVLLNVPCMVGWVFLATSNTLWGLFVGRICTGLAIGLASAVTNVYLAEVVKPAMRGFLICWNSISIALGILIVYILGSALPWRYAAWAGAVPALLAFVAAIIMPDSPSWLLSRSKASQAERSLIALRGGGGAAVRAEFEELVRAQEQRAKGPKAGWRNLSRSFRKPEFWKPLLILNVFFAFQQFSGIYVVIFYAVDVVQEAGVTMDKYLATVFIGVARLIATGGVSIAMRRYGRRPMGIISGVGMTFCMVLLGAHLYFTEGMTPTPLSWWPAVAVIGYIFTSTIGFLTLPWVMVGEVFPSELRGVGGGLTTCFAYLIGFAVLKAYPGMQHMLNAYGVFLVYGIVSFLATIFVIIWLPETHGKTLAQVEEYFAGPARRQNNSPPVMALSKPLLVMSAPVKDADKDQIA